MKVAVGGDPNTFRLKKEVLDELKSLGIETEDFGSEDPIYANVVIRVCQSVLEGVFDRGIVLCGTGIGASIAANKVPGIYCALVTNTYQAERAALSNNANVISLGAQITGDVIARQLVRVYVQHTYVPGGRSEPKIQRIIEYEKGQHMYVSEKGHKSME
jgi:ribose 5-phosphate isomerase B